MAIAYVTSHTCSGPSASGGTDTTGCDLLLVAAFVYGTETLSDSKGNSWTKRRSRSGNPGGVLYECVSPTVGTGHTTTVSGDPWNGHAMVGYSGVSPSSPFDQVNGSDGYTTDSRATGSVTPTEDNELVFVAGGLDYTSITGMSIDSPFVERNELNVITYKVVVGDDIQTAATARNATVTRSPGGTNNMSAHIITYKAAAAAVVYDWMGHQPLVTYPHAKPVAY